MKSNRYIRTESDLFILVMATFSLVMALITGLLHDYFSAFIFGAGSVFDCALLLFFPNASKSAATNDYSRMMETLTDMTESLHSLSEFLERERARVAETENIVEELEKRKEEREPVVTTQRDAVDAILTAHAARGRVSAWKERLAGFSFGIISSLVATMIWHGLVSIAR